MCFVLYMLFKCNDLVFLQPAIKALVKYQKDAGGFEVSNVRNKFISLVTFINIF